MDVRTASRLLGHASPQTIEHYLTQLNESVAVQKMEAWRQERKKQSESRGSEPSPSSLPELERQLKDALASVEQLKAAISAARA